MYPAHILTFVPPLIELSDSISVWSNLETQGFFYNTADECS